jgi:molybdopterin converting factor small subunit
MEKISIVIGLYGYLREATGMASVHLTTLPTMGDAILTLRGEYSDVENEIDTGHYTVVLNGLSLLGKNLFDVPVQEGDVVDLVPFVAGG